MNDAMIRPAVGDDPVPDNEQEILRQARVFASGLLARAGDPRLQAIVDEAAAAFGVPIAAITVIDRDRQYLPVSIGLGASETARAISFCDHAIGDPGNILCVPNALEDERFAANPVVTGPMHIRFYAGFPLAADDRPALGALCLIDRVVRPALTVAEEDLLRSYGARCLAEIRAGQERMRDDQDTIDHIVTQIEQAVADGNDRLVLALDAVLQEVEGGLAPASRRRGPTSSER